MYKSNELFECKVISWIRNGETMLAATFCVPTSLSEAEDMKKDHEKLKKALEVSMRIIKTLLKY